MAVDKKSLSEQDICAQFITPAIVGAGWDLETQVRLEYSFTAGQVIVKGKTVKRGKGKRADYRLSYRENLPLAVVEAKDNTYSIGAGMQQALLYADGEALDVPFVFSSNGDAFLFHDKTQAAGKLETEIALDAFPSPEELWERYCTWKGLKPEVRPLVTNDFYSDGSGKSPRYYQLNAINRTIEAIARGQQRVLLVMATGTGKTYTAFQIIWRLWKQGLKKRILFLADRNILVDQTRVNDFKPFSGAMTKITNRTIDKSFEVYLSLYQAITGTEAEQNIYREFSREFFDLIVIDECHRGSAKEDSQWREILEYFKDATQIGMTATPKETEYVSNIHYFGEPVYTYSLKQGIQDGFLAPYRVIRIDLDKDLEGWRPAEGETDKHGELIDDRIYNQKDFDRQLVLDKRTEQVAKKVTEFLKGTGDRYAKTIVFCEDIDHAERMRQALVNENADLAAENRKYVMRITGDNPEGKAELDNFIDPESRYPVIVTTSKLLTTGVDAQTCKLVVLDRRIQSMTEFKQIIGRGTRINEDYGKFYFTIMDFKKATELFADPKFDGPPISIYVPKPDEPVVPPEEEPDSDTEGEELIEGDPQSPGGGETGNGGGIIVDPPPTGRRKFYVDNVEVFVIAERVQYFDPQTGKLITESLKDYTRKRVGENYASLTEFIQSWDAADKKQAIIDELEERGVFFEALAEDVGKDFDPFDLVCHVAFDQPPLTRKERAENVKKRNYFTKYGDEARAVLTALLEKYADEGFLNLDDLTVLQVDPFSQMGTPLEIIQAFGGRDKYVAAIRELENHLYSAA